MNWRTILTWTIGLAATLALLLVGYLAYIAFVPPEPYTPPQRSHPDQSTYALEDKTGWYATGEGEEWLLTWRPQGGLMVLNFVDLAHERMEPVTAERYRWFRGGDPLEVRFADSAGVVHRFEWTDSTGTLHEARRMRNPHYDQELVHFRNGEIELAGTLLIPQGQPVNTGAVIIHGSGTSDRNNYWYLYQADYLAKQGVMVLLPDKRGSGDSGGEWHTASMQDFAEDAAAGARAMQQHPSADSLALGFLGFSQGGVIAPLAGLEYEAAAYVVNVVGSAVSFNEQLEFEIYNDVISRGVPSFLAPLVTAAYVPRAKARRPVWWEKNGSYSPTPYFRELEVPALVVYGGQDTNAPLEPSLENLETIRREKGDSMLTVRVYEESGHAMGDSDTGWIRTEYLQMLADWIKDRARLE